MSRKMTKKKSKTLHKKPGVIFMRTTKDSFAQMTPSYETLAIDICIGNSVSKNPKRIRKLAAWLLKAADYMEQDNYTVTKYAHSGQIPATSEPAPGHLLGLRAVKRAGDLAPKCCIERIFQKYDGRNLYQWHYRQPHSVMWHPFGPVLSIRPRKVE